MKPIWVDVNYFDAVNGGAGLARLNLLLIDTWLNAHPGYLIRSITMPVLFIKGE